MNKIVVYIIFSCCSLLFVQAQTVEDIMSGVYDAYMHKEPLQFNTTYNLYKTWESKEIIESYTGKFYKNASNAIVIKIDRTDIVNTAEFSLKISHQEKAVLVRNPENK